MIHNGTCSGRAFTREIGLRERRPDAVRGERFPDAQGLPNRGRRGQQYRNRAVGCRGKQEDVQEASRVASVAEVRAAVDAALQQVNEGQAAIQAAKDKLGEAQQSLAAALDGSASDMVNVAHASLSQAEQQLEESMSATLVAVEHAQTYTATL